MFTRLKAYTRPLLPVWRAIQRLLDHDGIEIAGFIAYTVLVSLFPFIIFLLSLAGFLGNAQTAQEVINAGFELLPREVAKTLSPIVVEIFKNEQPGLITLGIVGTLWVTSSGVEALRMGTIRGWEMEETRAVWHRRLTGFAFVILAGITALAAGIGIVAGPLVMNKLEFWIGISSVFAIVALIINLLLAYGILTGLVAVLYRYLPPKRIAWRQVWPGALLTAAGWILLASMFSLYLSQSEDYTVTYGSLGGVVITLLFLHFSAILFLLGVEFNAVLRDAASQRLASRRKAH